MKVLFSLIMIGLLGISFPVSAQDINEITAKGKKAYLETIVSKGDIPDAYEKSKQHLIGEEWNEWTIIDDSKESDFTLRLTFEKLGMNVVSMRSTGGRVRVVAEILDKEGKVLWKSKQHQGNATTFTGFNALNDALNKIVRRALSNELRGYNEKTEG